MPLPRPPVKPQPPKGAGPFALFMAYFPWTLGGALAVAAYNKRTTAAFVVAAVIAFLIAAWAAKRWSSRHVGAGGAAALTVLGLLVGGAASGMSVLALVLDRHVTDGSPSCESPRILVTTETCVGWDHSLMQGRLSYQRAEGVPVREECRAFLDDAKLPECSHGEPFTATACLDLAPSTQWHCFSCERLSGGGDMHRTLYAFPADCARAVEWASTNVAFSELTAHMRKAQQAAR